MRAAFPVQAVNIGTCSQPVSRRPPPSSHRQASSNRPSWTGSILRGLLAGLAGTAAISASQQVELVLTGRTPSATPAEALCLMLGVETRTEAEEQRLANEAHWAYGTMWGLGHSATAQVFEPARTLLYFAAVWAAGAALLTSTGLAPPPTRWKASSLVSDLAHHAVYAAVGSLAYHALERRSPARES